MSSTPLEDVPEPWRAFFSGLDSELNEEVTLCCLGGFVVSMCYGLPRPTADVDILSVHPKNHTETVLSALYRKHGVYLQLVTVANVPEGYEDRLKPMFSGTFKNIQLYGLDPYDLALSKIDRSSQRDRDDVKYLVKNVPLDRKTLEARYAQELRPIFAGEVRGLDLTLQLWIEAYYENDQETPRDKKPPVR